MRIGLLTPLLSPWAREVVRSMCAAGHSLHVIDFRVFRGDESYFSAENSFQEDEIREIRDMVDGLHFLDSRMRSGIRYVTCAPKVREVCRRTNVDLLLSLYGGGWGLLAYLSGVRPFAICAVGSDVLLAGRVNRTLSRRVFRAARIVFANGDYLASQTLEIAPRANVRPLLFGIDTSRFAPKPLPASPVKIICTRGFAPIYNNEYLIEAIPKLPAMERDWQVVFTSPGPSLEKAKRMADETLEPALRNRIAFLGGVPADVLLDHLQSSHVYVSLSRSDGTSTSLLEALSCNVFPVLSDIPQNREWIATERENGLLAPLDSPKDLAMALSRAIGDDELRRQAASVNRGLVVERADSFKNMAAMTECLEALG